VVNLELGDAIIELIEPVGEDSFVQQFIDKRGEGLHHLTFRAPELPATLAGLKAAGVRIVGERQWDSDSQEAFISPRSAHGVLIQFGIGFPHALARPQVVWRLKLFQIRSGRRHILNSEAAIWHDAA